MPFLMKSNGMTMVSEKDSSTPNSYLISIFLTSIYCLATLASNSIQLPPAARELDKELRAILKTKDEAIRAQKYEFRLTGRTRGAPAYCSQVPANGYYT